MSGKTATYILGLSIENSVCGALILTPKEEFRLWLCVPTGNSAQWLSSPYARFQTKSQLVLTDSTNLKHPERDGKLLFP